MLVSAPVSLTAPLLLKDFSDEMGDVHEYDLLTWYTDMSIFYNEIRQCWKISVT